MKQYELTGGARIGRGNATYPFAKLKVTANKLELNASIIGNLARHQTSFQLSLTNKYLSLEKE